MSQDKVYLLIELVTDGLNPFRLKTAKKNLLQQLDNRHIGYEPVPAPPEEGAMTGSSFWEKWVLELTPEKQEEVISQAQELWGDSVKLTKISLEDKNTLLNQAQSSSDKK